MGSVRHCMLLLLYLNGMYCVIYRFKHHSPAQKNLITFHTFQGTSTDYDSTHIHVGLKGQTIDISQKLENPLVVNLFVYVFFSSKLEFIKLKIP